MKDCLAIFESSLSPFVLYYYQLIHSFILLSFGVSKTLQVAQN